MISFHTQTIKFDLPQKRATKNWLKSVAEREHKKIVELAFVFCTDEELLQINRHYLQHDYYTDVITFDYSEGTTVSGDIFISIDTVHANAEEYKQLFKKELHRVMVHGLLHLCGYGDNSAREQKIMRAKEDFYLEQMGY